MPGKRLENNDALSPRGPDPVVAGAGDGSGRTGSATWSDTPTRRKTTGRCWSRIFARIAVARGERVDGAESLVQNLRGHRWFGGLAPFAAGEERTAHAAPGYPWLRGELERLPFVSQPAEPLLRWTQCVLGPLTAGLYFLFARRAFRSRTVGALSGLFCALHPFWIVSTATLTDGVLASFLLAACIYLGSRGGQAGGAR